MGVGAGVDLGHVVQQDLVVALRPVVADHTVMGDGEQPGHEWHVGDAIPAHRLPGLEECLLGQVLAVGDADTVGDVAVDAIGVPVVQDSKCQRVSSSSALNEIDFRPRFKRRGHLRCPTHEHSCRYNASSYVGQRRDCAP